MAAALVPHLRRAVARAAWVQLSSACPAFTDHIRSVGLHTSLEWWQGYALRQMLSSAEAVGDEALPASVLIAFAPGLGKTLTALGVVLAFGLRAVVVLPASLLWQWREEVAAHTDVRDEHVVTLQGRARDWPVVSPSARILLVPYATLAYAWMHGSTLPWHGTTGWCVVLDEAHYIANQSTQRFQSVLALVHNAGARRPCIALSGTPVKNGLGDMAALARVMCAEYESGSMMGDVRWWKCVALSHDRYAKDALVRWRARYIIGMPKDVLLPHLPPLVSVVRVYTPDEAEYELCDAIATSAGRCRGGEVEVGMLFDVFVRTNAALTHPLAPCGREALGKVMRSFGYAMPVHRSRACVRCHGARPRGRHVMVRVNEGLSSDDEDEAVERGARMCDFNHTLCNTCHALLGADGCPACAYEEMLTSVGLPLEPASVTDLIAMSSKTRQMAEVVASIPQDDTILVFSTSIPALYITQLVINTSAPWREVMHINYTVPPASRPAIIKAWKATPRAVLLSGTGVGGCGLNLVPLHNTGSGMWVLFCNATINSASMEQARDRAYRLGQRRAVTVLYFSPLGTIQSWEGGWIKRNHDRIAAEARSVLPELARAGVGVVPSRMDRGESEAVVASMQELVRPSRKRSAT